MGERKSVALDFIEPGTAGRCGTASLIVQWKPPARHPRHALFCTLADIREHTEQWFADTAKRFPWQSRRADAYGIPIANQSEASSFFHGTD
jgi:hypothetical protein